MPFVMEVGIYNPPDMNVMYMIGKWM